MQLNLSILVCFAVFGAALCCQKQWQCYDCGDPGATDGSGQCPTGSKVGTVTKKCSWCMKIELNDASTPATYKVCANSDRLSFLANEQCALDTYKKGCNTFAGCISGSLNVCMCKDKLCNGSTTTFASLSILAISAMISQLF